MLCSSPLWAALADQVAAVVEGEVITFSDIHWLVRYKSFLPPKDAEEQREFYLAILSRVVDQEIISREAEQTPGIHVSAQGVDNQLQAYRQRFTSDELFQEKLESMEMSIADLKALIRRELMVWQFIQVRFEPFVIVLPKQIKRYYEGTLLPELKQGGAPVPALGLVEEQIRQILTLEKTNEQMDLWVSRARQRAKTQILLFRDSPNSPNLPPEFQKTVQLRSVYESLPLLRKD